MKFIKLAEYLDFKLLKNADYPVVANVTSVINNVINGIKSLKELNGVKSVSNVEIQNQLEYLHVSFVLIVTNEQGMQLELERNQPLRDHIIQDRVLKALQQHFPGFVFKLDYATMPE